MIIDMMSQGPDRRVNTAMLSATPVFHSLILGSGRSS